MTSTAQPTRNIELHGRTLRQHAARGTMINAAFTVGRTIVVGVTSVARAMTAAHTAQKTEVLATTAATQTLSLAQGALAAGADPMTESSHYQNISRSRRCRGSGASQAGLGAYGGGGVRSPVRAHSSTTVAVGP